jgi:hypothetical protein
MKRNLLIATGLAVLSTGAFASKARLEALSQSNMGSYLFQDSRNLYLNAASMNATKNYVIIETGTNPITATSNNDEADDAQATPEAEGGFTNTYGNFAYGLYMGRDSNNGTRLDNGGEYSTLTAAAFGGNTLATGEGATAAGVDGFLGTGNNYDLFIAGDAGVQWGARLSYATNKDEGRAVALATPFERKQSALGIGLGMNMGDLGAFANLDLSDKSEGADAANDKWEADLGLDLGVTYGWNDYVFHARYTGGGFEYTNNGTAATEGSKSTIDVGAGKVNDMGAGAKWFWSIDARSTKHELKSKAAGSQAVDERKVFTTPLTVGLEVDATSWLTLRGSVSQSMLGNVEDTSKNAAGTATAFNGKKFKVTNTTNVATGATLSFGKLKVDGIIGTDGTTGTATASESGQLRLDNLMSRVAIHYWF